MCHLLHMKMPLVVNLEEHSGHMRPLPPVFRVTGCLCQRTHYAHVYAQAGRATKKCRGTYIVATASTIGRALRMKCDRIIFYSKLPVITDRIAPLLWHKWRHCLCKAKAKTWVFRGHTFSAFYSKILISLIYVTRPAHFFMVCDQATYTVGSSVPLMFPKSYICYCPMAYYII